MCERERVSGVSVSVSVCLSNQIHHDIRCFFFFRQGDIGEYLREEDSEFTGAKGENEGVRYPNFSLLSVTLFLFFFCESLMFCTSPFPLPLHSFRKQLRKKTKKKKKLVTKNSTAPAAAGGDSKSKRPRTS